MFIFCLEGQFFTSSLTSESWLFNLLSNLVPVVERKWQKCQNKHLCRASTSVIQTSDTRTRICSFRTRSRSITCGEKKHFKPYFGSKSPNFSSVFYYIWLVILHMQFLCPGDHWKRSYDSLPVHLNGGLIVSPKNLPGGVAKMAAERRYCPIRTLDLL